MRSSPFSALLFTLLTASTPIVSAATFTAPYYTYPATSQTISAVGFINADAHLDVFCGRVLLGDGTGSLQSADSVAMGRYPHLADLNNDGKQDLFGPVPAPSSVLRVRLGNGDGTFAPVTNYAIPTGGADAAAADLNGDTYLDIIIPSAGLTLSDGTFGVFLNNGDGTFGARTEYPEPEFPIEAITGDFNEDSIPDVAILDQSAGALSSGLTIYAGHPDGSLTLLIRYLVASGARDVTVGHINTDSHLDFAIVYGATHDCLILLGNGDGTVTGGFVSIPGTGTQIAIDDCDGDGFTDLIVSTEEHMLFHRLGNGDGTYLAAAPGTPTVGTGLTLADLNEDSRVDAIMCSPFESDLSVLAGNADGSFSTPSQISSPGGSNGIAIFDVDGDHRGDILVTDTANNQLILFHALGGGVFAAPVFYTGLSGPNSIAVADFNFDGFGDAVVTNQTSSYVTVFSGQANGTLVPANYSVGDQPGDVVAGDFNGDGSMDFAVANRQSNSFTVWYNTNLGAFGNRQDIFGATSPGSIAAGDLNGDNRLDIVILDVTNNRLLQYVKALNGGYSSMFGPGTTINPALVRLADFDGDGFSDAITGGFGGGFVSFHKGLGNGNFAARVATAEKAQWLVTGRFNIDLPIDVATVNAGLGVHIMLSNNNGTFATESPGLGKPFGPGGIAVGDLDGDGPVDFAVSTPSAQLVTLYLNTTDQLVHVVDLPLTPHLAMTAPFPNPSRGTTDFRLSGSSMHSDPVTVQLLDVRGRVLKTLYRGAEQNVMVHWDGHDEAGRQAAPGIYFASATCGSQRESRRIVFMP